MARTKKLRAGVGARATILTKFIKPPQPVPFPDHRSDVVILGKVENTYTLCHAVDNHFGNINAETLRATCRYVKVISEGDSSLLFGNDEPAIPWGQSEAKKLLLQDIMKGDVPLLPKYEDGTMSMDPKDIYSMRPQYAEYHYAAFSDRLRGLRTTAANLMEAAQADQEAFDLYVRNHPISYHSHKGYIQWQGSESQRLLKEDIKNGVLDRYRKKELWQSRPEYYDEIPLKEFRDKIAQELSTARYLSALKEKGKKGTYKYRN
jgi:hypothetical protein